MAITSSDTSCDNKVPSKSSSYAHSSKHSCRLLKLNFRPDSSISSATSKCSKPKINNSKCGKPKINNSKCGKPKTKSPYLTGDRIQLLSRVVEKRFVHKTDIVSSFPLAAKLYKTNSDDFKLPKKATKKVKKSVLTLPTDPAPVPQACTVSDMNESEYCDKNDEDRKRKVVKKRAPIQNNRKARVREKDFEFYDRDAEYCSQLNIDLDCSSTDMMKNFNGDSKRLSNRKKIVPNSNKTHTASNNLSDVWALLRNINRFQFRPSPPLSEESIVPVKRKTQKRPKKANRKDARLIETCRTQEFAYISSYELDKNPASNFSPSSSVDRITVINNKDEFDIICEQFEKQLLGTHDFLKDSNNSKNIIQKNKIQSKTSKKNVTALGNSGAKDNKLITLKKKKNNNLRSPVVEKSKSEMTDNSNGNKDSLIGTDILQYNGNCDILLHKTENDSIFPAKVSYIGSDHSGSSKAELPNKIIEQVSRYDKSLDIAVLNKQPEATANLPKHLDPQQRKPRLVTTMPSSCMIPKLTQTEIKRRLAHIRFPIVVLGKDQVSSSIQVMDYDPPQFNGLDHHIWPFMIEWSPNAPKDTKHHNNTLSRKCLSYLLDSNSASQISTKSRKTNTEVGICKQVVLKDKKQDSTTLKKKAIITPTPPSEITDKLIQCTKKQKSIVQLKDKMLNFLYEKSSNRDVNNYSYKNDGSKRITLNDNSAMAENKVTAITDSQLKPDNFLLLNDRPIKRPISIEDSNKQAPIYRYPWAKAKWASDFIDNVMKKIRSGVYYSQDLKDFCHTYQIDLQEVSVDAGSYRNRSITTAVSTQTCDSEADSSHDGTNDINQNNRISIPGFNNTLPLLEIQTLNTNQIAVKHCMTNIMVQFDVTVPAKTDKSTKGLNKTLPLTPIAITKSLTKVYKCKTTIFNAMLPAELCSILPELMSSIIDSNHSSIKNLASCITKTDSWLSTITELTRYENGDSSVPTSPEIKHILDGRFSNIDYKKTRFNQIDFKIKYDRCLATEILPTVSLNNLLKNKVSALVVELDNSQYKQVQTSLHQSSKQISGVADTQNHTICTSVQNTGSKNRLTSVFKPNQLVGMIESIMCSYNYQINQNLNSFFDMLKLQYDGKNVEIKMLMTNDSGVQKKIAVSISNLNIDSLYKAFPKIKNDKKYQMNINNTPLQCIEYINTSLTRKSENKELTQVTLKTAKRRGFYKVYRKCKSTNMPSIEKLTNTANTPLNKITTIDDFFQILGSKKIFSSVFDGNAAKNILSSLMEMKNWISEINPKQALLVLLLTNKKDTQNLVRYRPIILQGIAMNRITRASELDMEIEVIDREKLKPFPQFEGITYLSESGTDYENLLDELYWIAKTTASDYNKPFDESSVRLLKSLLQKRKKLNPSYLRVMARYVGLGLVKTPTS